MMQWLKDHNGKYSHTKFFSVVGYVVFTWAFVHYVQHGGDTNEMIWAMFGAVVIGNRTLNKFLEFKNGTAKASEEER